MRFLEVGLSTFNLDLQYSFYAEILQLRVSRMDTNSFSVRLPSGKLVFTKEKKFHPYHFAFNIPSHSAGLAEQWLKKRVSIIKHQNKNIVDFPNWNAQSLYFYDADENIVEFIARRNLDYAIAGKFSSNCILELSELGLATHEIRPLYDQLHQYVGIETYDGNFDSFCAIGTETGLFIVVNMQSKQWFPTGDKIRQADFEVKIEHLAKTSHIEYRDGILNIE